MGTTGPARIPHRALPQRKACRPATPRHDSNDASRSAWSPPALWISAARTDRGTRPAQSVASLPVGEELPGDDVALYLGGPLVNAHDAHVAVVGLDSRFAHVAHPAVDLHGGIRHLA